MRNEDAMKLETYRLDADVWRSKRCDEDEEVVELVGDIDGRVERGGALTLCDAVPAVYSAPS